MTTINIAVEHEPDSIVFADSLGTYGIKDSLSEVVVVVAGTVLTRVDALNYTYTFADLLHDTEYSYSVKVEYPAGVFTYLTGLIDGPGLVEEGLSWISRPDAETYFKDRLWITAWEVATDRDKEKSLTMATRIVERLALYAFSTIPQDLKNAICEIALALLNEVDPDQEFENLNLVTSQYSSVRSTYDRTFPMEHTEAGVPSVAAWRLIKPYLDVSKGLKLSRVS